MTKKKYIQPSMSMVLLEHRYPLLGVSEVRSFSESGDVDFKYEECGGNQAEAW